MAVAAALPVAGAAIASANVAGVEPVPPPGAQARSVEVPGGRLWCWDTGGRGDAVMLLHPATGSAAGWEHQVEPLRSAGLRIVAYSRRGHFGSPVVAGADPGYAADDVIAVADALGLDRFHLVGCAAGGFIAPECAIIHPQRLSSLILVCTQGGTADPQLRSEFQRTGPPALRQLPPAVRELGPSYRAADPDGVARWEALEHQGLIGDRVRQRSRIALDATALARIRTPSLVVAGGADLIMPVPLARRYAAMIPRSQFVAMPDCGHCPHWEQPEAFNAIVLDFVNGRRSRTTPAGDGNR